MADNPTIASLQNATKAAAENLVREREAAAKEKPAPPPTDDGEAPPATPAKADPPKPPAEAPPPPDEKPGLAAQIKEKFGIDISEEDLISRLKNGNGHETTPPAPVRDKGRQPKREDITDDAVSKWLKEQKKPDLVSTMASNSKKDDFALVREHTLSLIQQQFPDAEDPEKLFRERYYIPEDGDDTEYTDDEIALGKYLVKQDADRLRGGVSWQVEGIRDMLHQQQDLEYHTRLFQEEVDDFIKKQPTEIVLPLGKSGKNDLGDYTVKLEDATIKNVAAVMRDPVHILDVFRQKNDKGEVEENAPFDLPLMYNILMKAELFDHAIKSTASDFYSKGVGFVEAKLNNNPDLNKARSPEKKDTKKEEREKAEEYNRKQLEDNIGRGRKR